MIVLYLFIFIVVWIVAVYKVFIAETLPPSTDNVQMSGNQQIGMENSSEFIHFHQLEWPPIRKDGSIPPADGYDIMPVTNLSVPKFWQPLPNADLNTIGTMIDGKETILLMIASYRDFQCRETITSAFFRAEFPERLFVGVIDQIVSGDIGCVDTEAPCTEQPEQPICKYRDQISVFKMNAKYATGYVQKAI